MFEFLLIAQLSLPKCWKNAPPILVRNENKIGKQWYFQNYCKYGRIPVYYSDEEKEQIEGKIYTIDVDYKELLVNL